MTTSGRCLSAADRVMNRCCTRAKLLIWRRRIVVTLQILIGLAVLAVGALAIAVFVAKSQLRRLANYRALNMTTSGRCLSAADRVMNRCCTRAKRIVVTLQILIGLAVLAVGALAIAVFVAKSQLPSFGPRWSRRA
jgi:flagellar basal body-associated protein FliL